MASGTIRGSGAQLGLARTRHHAGSDANAGRDVSWRDGRWPLDRLSRACDSTNRACVMKRPGTPTQLAITFFYYRDLAAAMAFYEEIMGLTLSIDQGWCKIYEICPGAHVGLVDETKGMHKWAAVKPVQLCIRIEDVDAWFAYATHRKLDNLSDLFVNDTLGIRAFVFNDPEGYQIEMQSATRVGA
jgi:lactoylglutathione lyase